MKVAFALQFFHILSPENTKFSGKSKTKTKKTSESRWEGKQCRVVRHRMLITADRIPKEVLYTVLEPSSSYQIGNCEPYDRAFTPTPCSFKNLSYA